MSTKPSSIRSKVKPGDRVVVRFGEGTMLPGATRRFTVETVDAYGISYADYGGGAVIPWATIAAVEPA